MTGNERQIIVRRLEEDLIGPLNEQEELKDKPSDVYLTGILWPVTTRMGPEDNERLSIDGTPGSELSQTGGTGEEEEVSRRGMIRPCTAGISFAISSISQNPSLSVIVSFAYYEKTNTDEENYNCNSSDNEIINRKNKWKRHPVFIDISDFKVGLGAEPSINLESLGAPPEVYVHRRIAHWRNNDWLVTITLINNQRGKDRESIELKTLFQVKIKVIPGKGTRLIARPSRKGLTEEELDEESRSTALLYRNALEFAVGHTCSAEWDENSDEQTANYVSTTWIPHSIVPATSSTGHPVFSSLRRNKGIQPLSALWMSTASNFDLGKSLSELPAAYNSWIEIQERKLESLQGSQYDQAVKNIETCRLVSARIAEGAKLISNNAMMAEAFRLANRAMHIQHSWDTEKNKHGPLIWRPFQLGFILLAASSVADRTHQDRRVMDLLWFPTGGGKTEAYLGLIAFLAFYRRLNSGRDPDTGGGVAAVMRYTLRLLTTQQFARAASMILACECIRRGKVGYNKTIPDLGKIPFSIGLWVGGEATPNSYEEAAKSLQGETDTPSPAQLADCPACGNRLEWYNERKEKSIHVRCNNRECILFSDKTHLPVFTVDDDIYYNCPTLLIGTVDKFAQIVRKSEVNSLFSIQHGHPPDLIIQDELHLISGPLGTLAGLYEVAIDEMFSKSGVYPKIIGSTATIRRATEQVRALFNRDICQFPPPAIDADDSGFAIRDPDSPGRLYVGITTAGRSAKFTLRNVAASLLQSSYGGLALEDRNFYWTLVSYFNSLRELGGALVLMQDDVNDDIESISKRRNENGRPLDPELTQELTSRRTQAEIRDMLDRLSIPYGEEGCLDIVLATNMLSVGVDIPRLGLMIVNGQPKGISEYIQATSRVGRGVVPGLIIAILNNAKPRDRSHYESFATWHSTLYRDVEATSVTPFASRARDRSLHAVLVSLVRHLVPGMLNDPPILTSKKSEEAFSLMGCVKKRVTAIDVTEVNATERELLSLLDEWQRRNLRYYWNDIKVQDSLLQSAERAATMRALGKNPGRAWETMNNLRNVEPSTRFRLAERLYNSNEGGDDDAS